MGRQPLRWVLIQPLVPFAWPAGLGDYRQVEYCGSEAAGDSGVAWFEAASPSAFLSLR